MKAILRNSTTGAYREIAIKGGTLEAVCDCNVGFGKDLENGVFYCTACHYPLFINYPGYAPDFYRANDGDTVLFDSHSVWEKQGMYKCKVYEAMEVLGEKGDVQ